VKKIRGIFTLLLTAVFIYSIAGQAVISHYCSNEEQDCHETSSCCTEEEEIGCCTGTNDALPLSHGSCCTVMASYMVNPFSIQQPQQKKNIQADALVILPLAELNALPVDYFFERPLIYPDLPPFPGRIVLLQKSILII
jgi:hypothetical protein